jgi:hypothetical protein
MDIYYLASLKLSGWMSKTGQYTTDIKDAREFTRAEALAMVARQRGGGNVIVPVCKEDLA